MTEYREKDERKKVVLFGSGNVFRTFMEMCKSEELDVIGVCDNDKDKQGKNLGNGIKIYCPEYIKELEYDYVVITTMHVGAIKRQLLQLGVEPSKILDFYTVFERISILKNTNWKGIIKDDVLAAMLAQNSTNKDIRELKEIGRKNLFINAKNYTKVLSVAKIERLEDVEFQVFSQFGEDGIIQWLIHNVEIPNKTFVEFGVGDYTESNTRFLLMNNNWSGLVIEGNENDVANIKAWELFWKYDLTAVNDFITKDNINQIITDAGFEGDIGILSVDIDGNDYWVLNAIDCVRPRILICEYNSVLGEKELVTIPYKEDFYRTDSHYSNLYWGASLGAFIDYADKNGYLYFGSNSAGNNAFFVRKDSVSEDLVPSKCREFVCSKYRESVDPNGRLTFLKGKERLEVIKDMPLYNLSTQRIETIAEIYQI